MKPREHRETGEQDLFRSRLDQIIDLRHPLVRLAHETDWAFLERTFGEAYRDGPGQPPLPTRLMAGLMILKYTHNLSDEALCERWVENPYYQYFCGEEFFQHELVLDRSSLSNWRKRMGEQKVQALVQESLSIAVKTGAIKPAQLSEVIIDTTVQPKNVMFPTGARLLNRAREILVRLAKAHGVDLRQSYTRVGKIALIKHQRYAHAKQFKRANRSLKKLRTYLGRVIRDIARKIEGDAWLEEMVFSHILALARRVRDQKAHQRGPKVYSLHAPEVECIGQGPSALRIRRQGIGRHDPRPCQGRAVRHAREGAAGQPIRRSHAQHRDPGHGSPRWQHPPAHVRRQRLSRSQRADRLQVQGLHCGPKAAGDAQDQARDAKALRRRAGHRPHEGRAPHGPQLPLVPPGRCHQCRPRRGGLQLQPPAQVVAAIVAPNPGGAQRQPSPVPSLKTGFFTDDSPKPRFGTHTH